MKVERPDAWFVRSLGAGLAALGLGLGAFFGGWPAALLCGTAGVVASLLTDHAQRRRWTRRRAIVSSPFPPSWRRILEERYDHYHRLPAELRPRFEDDLRLFAAEKALTGVGIEVTAEMRVLVAASAVTLSLGWPDYEWDQLTEVLLYPQDFDRDYSFDREDRSGEAHPWGTVILSVPSLISSFDDPDDGYHVGIHEFAHILELEQTRFDGIPVGLAEGQVEEWGDLVKKEMDRLRRGKSALDPYGGEDPTEFLAVAVEAFFETPLLLRRRHREVYDFLARYFRQDPAAWDGARGLAL